MLRKVMNTIHPGDILIKDDLDRSYKDILKKIHPDVNNNSLDSTVATTVLQALYKKAKEDIKNDIWKTSNSITIKDLTFNYTKEFKCDIGTCYFNYQQVFYIFDDYKNLFDSTIKNIDLISSLLHKHPRFTEEFSKYLPTTYSRDYDRTNLLLSFPKSSSNIVPLLDIYNYFKTSIPHNHVAWILSSLYNICCFLEHFKLVHNGITINNIFIDIDNHYALLFGGWWFTTFVDTKMIGISKDLYSILPLKVRDTKMSNIQTDLESIRYIGKFLLGIEHPPKEIYDWLNNEFASKSSVEEFKKWSTIVKKVYGEKRKFTKLTLS